MICQLLQAAPVYLVADVSVLCNLLGHEWQHIYIHGIYIYIYTHSYSFSFYASRYIYIYSPLQLTLMMTHQSLLNHRHWLPRLPGRPAACYWVSFSQLKSHYCRCGVFCRPQLAGLV